MGNNKNYADITKEDFDERLQNMIDDFDCVLTIAGIYEILSEYFNNDILSDYENDNDHFMDYATVNEMFSDGLTIEEMRRKYNYDDTMLREDYNNYTDMLCKDGEISDYAYNNWDNPY